ncbi:MAG: class I SAM-dependent methyltransferase [Burkholderiaceae bacterium]|nr:class I SAM-dependent methyltransferase [Burkholderiaceae bacterium]
MSTLRVTAHAAAPPEPSPWVQRWLSTLPAGASVLDFAAGSGRHAREARRLGLRATAIDRDADALAAAGEGVATRVADLESGEWPFAQERFDGVVVTNYLFRPRFALLAALVAPGGLLVCETFAQGNERYGRPSNPAFLLAPGELFDRCRSAGLRVLAYEHGLLERPRPAVVQRVCAARVAGTEALRALG